MSARLRLTLFSRCHAVLPRSGLPWQALSCFPSAHTSSCRGSSMHVAGTQALQGMLRREARKASEARPLSSTAFSSLLSREAQPRRRFEGKLAAKDRSAGTQALWDSVSPWYYRVLPGSGPGPSSGGPGAASGAAAVAAPTDSAMVVPFDWGAAVRATAAALPYEGVTEDVFVSRLLGRCPGLPARSGAELALLLGYEGVPTLAGWVAAHFSDALLLTRSAATGEPLYYRRVDNNVLPRITSEAGGAAGPPRRVGLEEEMRVKEVTALQHALHLLGRDKQLPVWTDFAKVVPLLPTAVCPAAGEWTRFLAQPHIRALFDVDATVSVRYAGEPVSTHVVVDTTSVSEGEAETWLGGLRSGCHGDAVLDVKVLVRPEKGGDGERRGGALGGAEVVLVERLLDPEHVIGALVNTLVPEAPEPQCADRGTATETSSPHHVAAADDGREERDEEEPGEGAVTSAATSHPHGTTTVHVLCSDSTAAAITESLRDVQRQRRRQGTALAVFVHTPTKPATPVTADG